MQKSDLGRNIKVGSKVVFIDTSYTLSIINGVLQHTSIGKTDKVFTVVAINVPCPTDDDISINGILNVHNNCIVIDENKDIHFCSHINIFNVDYLFTEFPHEDFPYFSPRI